MLEAKEKVVPVIFDGDGFAFVDTVVENAIERAEIYNESKRRANKRNSGDAIPEGNDGRGKRQDDEIELSK